MLLDFPIFKLLNRTLGEVYMIPEYFEDLIELCKNISDAGKINYYHYVQQKM